MFVRAHRYRIQPERLDEYLEIQRRAHELDQALMPQRTVYLRHARDPYLWLELHWYASAEMCRLHEQQAQEHPQTSELWRAFQATLDPAFPSTVEDFFQHANHDVAAESGVPPRPRAHDATSLDG